MTKVGKITLTFLVILIILIMAAFAILLVFQGKALPFLNRIVTVPFVELSPNKVIKAMQKQMMFSKTAHYQINSDYQSLSPERPVGVQTQAVFDGGWQDGITGHLIMNNEITLQNLSYLANLEIRSTEEKSYFRVTEIPAIPFVDLEKIRNKWYVYTSKISSEDFNQFFLKIQTLLLNNNLFTVVERLPDKIINGSRTYHYTVKIDKEVVQKVLEALPENFNEQNNNLLEQLDKKFWEVWIGKKDRHLYKLTGELKNKNAQISFEVGVSQFNKVVTIEEPSESYSMIEFSLDLFGNTNFLELPLFGYSVGIDTKDLIEDADEDGLYTIWENVFKTDPDNPDTDGDGYLDGEEIRNGYNPKGKGKLFNIE